MVRTFIKTVVVVLILAVTALVLGSSLVAVFTLAPEGILRPTPVWWGWVDFLPLVDADSPSTIYPFIYLPQEMHVDALSKDPSESTEAVLVHERIHIRQESREGLFSYTLKYIFLRKFRLAQELEAIEAEMTYRKAHGLSYNVERKALQFSTSDYLWTLPYSDARRILELLWESS